MNSDLLQQIGQIPPALIPGAVMLAAVLGSPHCLVMCGPICFGCTQGKSRDITAYHLGRGLSYLLLGLIAGYLGEKILGEVRLELLLGILVALIILFAAKGLLQQGIKSLSIVPMRWTSMPQTVRAFLFGSFSGILPCGFLYLFVLAAVATQNLWAGGLILFSFWLGTIPVLTAAQFYIRKYMAWLGPRFVVFSQIGIVSLFVILTGLSVYHRGRGLMNLNQDPALQNQAKSLLCLPQALPQSEHRKSHR